MQSVFLMLVSFHITNCCAHLVLSDDGLDLSSDLIVQGTEVLLVGSEEVEEFSGSFSGDGGDVGGSVLDERGGQSLNVVEGVSGDGGDVADDGLDALPGSAAERADLVPDVTEEAAASELLEEGRGSGLQKCGQVQLGDQALGVGEEAVDGALEVEVLDEVNDSAQALSTEETTEETAEEVGQNVAAVADNVRSEGLELSPGVLELLDGVGGHLLTGGNGILDLFQKLVGVLFQLLDEGGLDVRSASGKANLEQGLAQSGLSTLDQVGRKSGLGNRDASEESDNGDLHFRVGFGVSLYGLKISFYKLEEA